MTFFTVSWAGSERRKREELRWMRWDGSSPRFTSPLWAGGWRWQASWGQLINLAVKTQRRRETPRNTHVIRNGGLAKVKVAYIMKLRLKQTKKLECLLLHVKSIARYNCYFKKKLQKSKTLNLSRIENSWSIIAGEMCSMKKLINCNSNSEKSPQLA